MAHWLIVHNIGLLQTPVGSSPRAGKAQDENLRLTNASMLIRDGVIEQICGEGESVCPPDGCKALELDACGLLVTPGLVDAHTHLIFGGWRQHEVALKLKGTPYLDILKAGGGILDTVRQTRAASAACLLEKAAAIRADMLAHGVTACEAKSGYGLNLEDECKQLEVIAALNREQDAQIVPTFMGAHAVPEAYAGRADAYVDFLCDEVIPLIADRALARFCDVFCESSVFTAAQSRRVLECALRHGLGAKIHADEIEPIGGAELAGELRAVSAEHLIATSDEGIGALARGGVVAVLLPQTSFYLDKPYARARDMIERGVPVAVATDFNPGSCPSHNLQLAMNLAMLKYKMTPAEVLTAVTLNAACAMGEQRRLGTLEPGKQADFVIWDAPDADMLCYRFGTNLTDTVVVNGQIAYTRRKTR